MPLPPPGCDCGHVYTAHENGGRCRVFLRHDHRTEEDAESHARCDRCPCQKFRVPRGGPRPAHRAPKSKKKGTPWWR